MIRPFQVTNIGGLQAPTMPLQAGSIPGTAATQIDINSIMNLMMMMMVMVMMIKMMSGVTAGI